jgi:hypothetical protein
MRHGDPIAWPASVTRRFEAYRLSANQYPVLDTYADLFDTDLDAVAEALDLKCAQSVPEPRPLGAAGT